MTDLGFRKYCFLVICFLALGFSSNLRAQDDQRFEQFKDSVAHLEIGPKDAALCRALNNENYQDLETQAWLHRALFKTKLLSGAADSALDHALKGYKIDVKLGDKVAQAADISNILAYYLDTDQPHRAVRYAEKLIELLSYVRNPYHQFVYLQNVGAIYQDTGDITKALAYYDQAQSIATRNGITSNLGWTYQNMGSLYINDLKDTVQSRAWFKKALHLADSLQETEIRVFAYIGLARCCVTPQDSLRVALQFLHTAQHLAAALGIPRINAEIADLKAHCYSELDDFEEAYAAMRNYLDIKTEIMRNEKTNVLAEMEHGFEAQLKNAEIAQNQEKAEAATQWKNIFLGASILITVFVVVVVLFFSLRQRVAVQRQTIATQRIEQLIKEQDVVAADALIIGQEQERQRIARELHDRVGGMLSGVKINFENIKQNLTNENLENVTRIYNSSAMLSEAYEELRRISHNLESSDVQQSGLIHAIEKLSENVRNNTKVAVENNFFLQDVRIKTHIQTHLYRVVQELVTNTLKHAKAVNKISISITQHTQELNIIYEDNGEGLSPKHSERTGIGMKNIRQRIDLLNGTFVIETQTETGFVAVICVPI